MNVAKRSRYRQMESTMSKIILADVLIFVLYLVCSGYDSRIFKMITAIIAILASVLCLFWLYLTGEFGRRRSLWMVTLFASVVICVVVSLLLGYPCPAPAA